MKFLFSFSLIALLLFGAAAAQDVSFPNYTGYVNDFANVIDIQTRQKIESVCTELEKTTGAELAVVTVKTVSPLDSKTYSVKLFEKWGIGKKAVPAGRQGKDNGILFLLAVEDRRVEIEVGYGLEGIVNDAQAGQILDENVIPFLKKNQSPEAMLAGATALANRIEKGYTEEKTGKKEEQGKGSLLPYVLIIIVLILFISLFTRNKGAHVVGGVLGAIFGYIFMQSIIGAIIGAIIGFLFGLSGGGIMRGGMGGFGGGWGGGGGGGGFGGFGGGRSGGGGAGRSF